MNTADIERRERLLQATEEAQRERDEARRRQTLDLEISAAAVAERRGYRETPPEESEKSRSFLRRAGSFSWNVVRGAAVDAIGNSAITLYESSSQLASLAMRPFVSADRRAQFESNTGLFTDALRDRRDEIAPVSEGVAEGTVRGIAQFVVPFIGWSRGIVAAATLSGRAVPGSMATAAGAGVIADLTVWSETTPTLSTLLNDNNIGGPLAAYLAVGEDDTAAEIRLKQAIEGLALGGAADAVFSAFRAIRSARQASKAARALPDPSDVRLSDIVEPDPVVRAADDVPPLVRSEADDASTVVLRTEDGTESIAAMRRGEGTIQITEATVAESVRGRGRGQRLIEELYDVAQAEGRQLVSDTEVSVAQLRAYEALKRKGWRIEYSDEAAVRAALEAGDPAAVVRNHRPVVEVIQRPDVAAAVDATPAFRHLQFSQRLPDGSLNPTSLREALRPEDADRLARMIAEGDYESAGRMLAFNPEKFDWSSVADGQQLQDIFASFERFLGESFASTTGGVQSNRSTLALARTVGLDGDEAVGRLLRDVQNESGLAARITAGYAVQMSSAERVRGLALAWRKTQDNSVYAQLVDAVEMHGAIMAHVKGAQTEIARAMQSMKMLRAAQGDVLQADELLRQFNHFKSPKALVDTILDGNGTLNAVNAAVNRARGMQAWNVLGEYVVNNLLSGIPTAVVNAVSNTAMTLLLPFERYMTGIIRGMREGTLDGLREANLKLVGQLQALADVPRIMGAVEGFRLHDLASRQGLRKQAGAMLDGFPALRQAVRAFRDEAPIMDPRAKIETVGRRGIIMEGDDWYAQSINAVGQVVRMPSRGVLTADEFFKTALANGERNALAYRKAISRARSEGLSGTALTERTAQLHQRYLESPTLSIEQAVIQEARRGTFQEVAETATGRATEQFLNSHPLIKLVVAPFLRTPMNILRQVFVDRTPLSLFMDNTRRTLSQGGPEAAEVAARMATGTGAILMGYQFVLAGGPDKPWEVVGAVPRSRSDGLGGPLPYSIRIGDRWFQFNRLDPIGSWLGFAADIVEYERYHHDPYDPDADHRFFVMFQGALGAVWGNAINKTWLLSLRNIVDTIGELGTGDAGDIQRATARFVGDQGRKLIPYAAMLNRLGVTGIPGITEPDDVVRDAWTVTDRLRSGLPGFRDGLPARRDWLGREITREGMEAYLYNPFAISDDDRSPLALELRRLQFSFNMPPKSIDGVPLDAAQYSRWLELTGAPIVPGGRTLEDELQAMVESPAYINAPSDDVRVDMIKGIRSARSRRARLMLLQEDEALREAIARRSEFDRQRRAGFVPSQRGEPAVAE